MQATDSSVMKMEEKGGFKGGSLKAEVPKHLTAAPVSKTTNISNVVDTEKPDGSDPLGIRGKREQL